MAAPSTSCPKRTATLAWAGRAAAGCRPNGIIAPTPYVPGSGTNATGATPAAAGGTASGGTAPALGVDANGRASIDWGVYGVPETFVVGRDGRIAYKLIGPISPQNLEQELRPAIEKSLAQPGAG